MILAALSDQEIAAYIERTVFVPPLAGAKVGPRVLWRAVSDVRRDGYAETHNKRLDEGASVSAAVRGPAGDVIGALTVAVAIGRYTVPVGAAAIDAVISAGQALSMQLGAR